jgi:protein ImuB
MEPFSWQLPERKAEEPAPLPASVLRRFRAPVPGSVLLAKDLPIHFRAAKVNGAVRAQKGPYLASGNWWDAQAWDRTEWDIELDSGGICQCHASDGQWALDGIYD